MLDTLYQQFVSQLRGETVEVPYRPFERGHELELARVLLALTHLFAGKKVPLPKFKESKTGAIPLFRKGYFSWEALPYPKEHAELGVLCFLLAKKTGDEKWKEIAERIARWQLKTLDHRGFPLHALFTQEGGTSYLELLEANYLLNRLLDQPLASHQWQELKGASLSPLTEWAGLPEGSEETLSLDEEICDAEIGLCGFRSQTTTLLSVGGGCKSGMGAFFHKDIGLINYGPQLSPLGDFQGFGLAGPAADAEYEEGKLKARTPLAAPSNRKTPFPQWQDSGYSGLWVTHHHELTPHSLKVHCHFEGTRSLDALSFTFLGKAEGCKIAGTHKLSPRSLDRYAGPPQPILLEGRESSLSLEILEGARRMEVIPLAGDQAFWGADFLISFQSLSPHFKFVSLC